MAVVAADGTCWRGVQPLIVEQLPVLSHFALPSLPVTVTMARFSRWNDEMVCSRLVLHREYDPYGGTMEPVPVTAVLIAKSWPIDSVAKIGLGSLLQKRGELMTRRARYYV